MDTGLLLLWPCMYLSLSDLGAGFWKWICGLLGTCFLPFFFLVGLVFELRALHLYEFPSDKCYPLVLKNVLYWLAERLKW
jgi:hypothetical protein